LITARDNTPLLVPNLRFAGFDASWHAKEIGDIAKVKHGFAFKGEFFTDSGTYVVLTPGNFELGGGFRSQGEKEKFYSDPDFPKDYILQKGDLVTAMTEQAVGLIGSPLIVPENGKFLHNQRLGLFQFAKGEMAGFLYFAMQTNSLQREFSNSAAGSKVRHTSPKRIETLLFITPNLPEQKKIADFLTAVDKRIGQLNQKKALLEEYKKGVMQQLFAQTIRFKDDDGNDFPDWEENKIGEYIELLSGFPFPSEEILDGGSTKGRSSILLMRGTNITEGSIRHSPDRDRFYCGSIDKLDKYKLEVGDMVIGMDGSKVGKNSAIVGRVEAGSLLVQRVARIRAVSGVSLEYIYQHINSFVFHRYVDRVKTSSGIPHISAKQIREFKIEFPSFEEQIKIAGILTVIDKKIESVSSQITETQIFKRGLLQQMFI
jgi:type I restriction enzyme S subunit